MISMAHILITYLLILQVVVKTQILHQMPTIILANIYIFIKSFHLINLTKFSDLITMKEIYFFNAVYIATLKSSKGRKYR